MQAIYQHSWKRFLIAISMVPTAYGQGETILVANFINGNTTFFSLPHAGTVFVAISLPVSRLSQLRSITVKHRGYFIASHTQ